MCGCYFEGWAQQIADILCETGDEEAYITALNGDMVDNLCDYTLHCTHEFDYVLMCSK